MITVKLRYGLLFSDGFHSRERFLITGLGCWGSLVQIQSRRPSYLVEITQENLNKTPLKIASKTAHKCTKTRENEGGAYGKIAVRNGPHLPALFIKVLRALESFHCSRNTHKNNHNLNNTLILSRGNNGTKECLV